MSFERRRTPVPVPIRWGFRRRNSGPPGFGFRIVTPDDRALFFADVMGAGTPSESKRRPKPDVDGGAQLVVTEH